MEGEGTRGGGREGGRDRERKGRREEEREDTLQCFSSVQKWYNFPSHKLVVCVSTHEKRYNFAMCIEHPLSSREPYSKSAKTSLCQKWTFIASKNLFRKQTAFKFTWNDTLFCDCSSTWDSVLLGELRNFPNIDCVDLDFVPFLRSWEEVTMTYQPGNSAKRLRVLGICPASFAEVNERSLDIKY